MPQAFLVKSININRLGPTQQYPSLNFVRLVIIILVVDNLIMVDFLNLKNMSFVFVLQCHCEIRYHCNYLIRVNKLVHITRQMV